MQNLFDINNIAFEALGYKMSYLELAGTAFGLWAVWLSTKERISSWYIGIVNVLLFLVLFYQIQLYSDMFLQIYFLLTNIYGWWRWTHPLSESESNSENQLKISTVPYKQLIAIAISSVFCTVLFGYFIANIHLYFPIYFPKPAAFPYADTFVMVISIVAQWLMTQKKIECWYLWMAADVLATFLYFQKAVLLMSIEYFLFTIIAFIGLLDWKKVKKTTY